MPAPIAWQPAALRNTNASRKPELAPFEHKRLLLEGVLIECRRIKRGDEMHDSYNLTFASVYAPNANLELDHIILNTANRHVLTWPLFKWYRFSVEVYAYEKPYRVYLKDLHKAVTACRRKFNVKAMKSPHTFEKRPDDEFSIYLQHRITYHCHHSQNAKAWLRRLKACPNNGERERLIETELTLPDTNRSVTNHQRLSATLAETYRMHRRFQIIRK